MVDRTNYLRQIETDNLRSDYFVYDEWIDYITNEILWSELLKFLTRELVIDPELVFLGISYFVVGVFSYIIASRYNPWALILLINPLVIDFAFSQLRLALAIAILGCFYILKLRNKTMLIIVTIICSMLHTTVPIFMLIYLAAYFIGRSGRLTQMGKKSRLVLSGLSLALVLGPLREPLFEWTQDRRLTYGSDQASSIVYLSFWIVLLLVLLFFYDDWSKDGFESQFAIVILTLIASSLVFSGYPTRFLAASFPLLVIAIVEMSKKVYGLLLLIFVVYSIFQWLYWFGLV